MPLLPVWRRVGSDDREPSQLQLGIARGPGAQEPLYFVPARLLLPGCLNPPGNEMAVVLKGSYILESPVTCCIGIPQGRLLEMQSTDLTPELSESPLTLGEVQEPVF